MTFAASQVGFDDVYGTSVSALVDVDASSGWMFDLYADNVGKAIIIDMGGWFDGSQLGNYTLYTPSQSLVPAGAFAMQLSADGINWYNMPDDSSSLNLGYQNLTSAEFTPYPDDTHFRYIRFIGVGGSHDLPDYLKSTEVYHSYLTSYTNIGFGAVGGGLLSIDTSGDPNPEPPVGPPDEDGGSGNAPGPVPDSNVPARTTSVALSVMRSDPGEVHVTGVSAHVAISDPGEVHVTGVVLAVLSLIASKDTLEAHFTDGATLYAKMLDQVRLEAHFEDRAILYARMDGFDFLAIHFEDEALLSARLRTAQPVAPQQLTIIM